MPCERKLPTLATLKISPKIERQNETVIDCYRSIDPGWSVSSAIELASRIRLGNMTQFKKYRLPIVLFGASTVLAFCDYQMGASSSPPSATAEIAIVETTTTTTEATTTSTTTTTLPPETTTTQAPTTTKVKRPRVTVAAAEVTTTTLSERPTTRVRESDKTIPTPVDIVPGTACEVLECPPVVAPIVDVALDAIHAAFPPEAWNNAEWVAECESSQEPSAVNRKSGDYGLFQLNRKYQEKRLTGMGYSWAQWSDPHVNAKVAANLWAEQGWKPWSWSKSCWGKHHN